MGNNRRQKGFGLVEMIVAIGLWATLGGSALILILGSLRTNRLADESGTAAHLAAEGIDAVEAISKQGWNTPLLATDCSSGCGLATVSGTWAFSGTSNSFEKFSRQIFITPVNRDGLGNIVSIGGVLDPDTYKLEARVVWSRGVPPVSNTVSLISYLTNYTKISKKGGMLVYGDGGTASDAIKYKIYDGVNWGTASATADVDSGTSNRYLRAARVYASASRNEKILLSRHYDGKIQYIYGQVFNGSSWGSVVLLSSWTANTFLDVQNFDGGYLANGDFAVIYSDNTSTPKMRVWNGTSWGSQISLNILQSAPIYVTARARPGTNEMMAVIFNSGKRTQSQYFNGAGYSTANWSAVVTHATNATANTVKAADFDWSPNNSMYGALVFEENTKFVSVQIFTANGGGGGSWSTQVNSSNQANNAESVLIDGRNGADEFVACDKDNAGTPRILCYQVNNFIPTLSTPVNNLISSVSQNGIQLSMDFRYETNGNDGLIAYSDNTVTPKYKMFNAATDTFSATPGSISALNGVLHSVRIRPVSNSDDMMLIMGDASLDVYTIVWDGANNVMYSTPASMALSVHGTNGSVATDYWYDFVWDNY